MTMQTKTLSNLVLEFPALEESKGKSLKGGSYDPWAEIARSRGDYTYWGGAYWGTGGDYIGPAITVYGSSWHNDPYDVRNQGGGGSYTGNNNYGSGGGGGGGGASDHYLNQANLPQAGHPTNFKNACVFDTFEVVDRYYGGGKNFLDFVIDYKGIAGVANVLRDGFTPQGNFASELKSFADNYFNTNAIGNNFTSAVNALDNGHPIIATIWNDAAHTDGHEVTIVGYTDAGLYRYYDSQTGNYTDRSAGDFDGMIEITGKK